MENNTACGILNQLSENLLNWAEGLRAPGVHGRFKWAFNSVRDANIASTSYLLGGLQQAGLLEDFITEDDRNAGMQWLESLKREDGQFYDPAIIGRKPDTWPEDKEFPGYGLIMGMSQYASSALQRYGADISRRPEPPQNIPGLEDADKAVEWIKNLSWDTNPWGAGSHGMRMARWLLDWHLEGKLPLDYAIEAIDCLLSYQNRASGLWGNADIPVYQRINGTFKVFVILQDRLFLPLPQANQIINMVLHEFQRPDYYDVFGPCNEFDNIYVLALALRHVPERRDEVNSVLLERLEAYKRFIAEDGGLSASPEGPCATTWLGVDMAQPLCQGDVFSLGIHASGINICVDLLGVTDQVSWTGKWRMNETAPEELREKIISKLKNI